MEFCLGQTKASLGGGGAPLVDGRDANGVTRTQTKRLAFTHNLGQDPHFMQAQGPSNPANFDGFARYHRVKFTANHGQDEHFVTGGRRAPTGKIADSAIKRDFIAHHPKSQVGGCVEFGRGGKSCRTRDLASYNKVLRDVRVPAHNKAASYTRSEASYAQSRYSTPVLSPRAAKLNAEISSQVLCNKALEQHASSSYSILRDECSTLSPRSNRTHLLVETSTDLRSDKKSVAPTVRNFGCVSVGRAPLVRSKVRRSPNAPSIEPKEINSRYRDDVSVRTAGLRTYGNPMGKPLCTGALNKGRAHQANSRYSTRAPRSKPWDITNDVTRVAPIFRQDQAAALE